jgi:glycosyltransferase involved in cell wall biosynthesis
MEPAAPLVSIITPSFNQGRFIEETLLSVQNQAYKNIEHLVIDGGSTDHTLEILRKYTPSISWISEPDTGQTDAINKGIQKSHGEIIAYLNSDDLYPPDTIKTVVDYFTGHPDVDMVYGDIVHIDEQSRVIEEVKTGTISLEQYMTCQVYLPQPSVFFRKTVVEKIGYFDKNLHLAMDLDYWIRIFLAVQTAYIPQPLAKARFYGETKSNVGYLKNFSEWVYILEKTFRNEELPIAYFGSRDRAAVVKTNAYAYIYFFGGLRFLRYRKISPAIQYISRGLKLKPRLVFNPYLFWSVFVFVFGIRTSECLLGFLPRIKKV